MPDNYKSPGPPGPQPEPVMHTRLLLAFLLMGAVLFLTPYFYKLISPPPAAQPAQTPAAAAKPAAPVQPAPEAPPPAAAPKPAQPPPAPASAEKEELFQVDTQLYHIVFSNRGAVVRSWVLKKYKDSAGHPLELVDIAGAAKAGYPFALTFAKAKLPIDVNKVLYAAHPAPGGLGIEYDYSDGNVAVRKTFRFEQSSYLSQVTTEVTQGGKGVPNLIEWRGGFGDAAVQNHSGQQRTLFYDTAAGKLNTKVAKDAKDGPVSDYGTYSFAGIEDNYFASVFLPSNDGRFEIRTVSDNVPSGEEKKEEPHAGAEVGGAARNEFGLFVGPKDVDVLRKVDPRLEQLVDFGRWFGWLAKPLFVALNWINDHMTHNYGWAIVVLTIVINSLILPLRLSSMKSMKKMQALKPQIDAINAKYKNVGLRDPRKADQQAEVMEFYKKHGVNPMGGCLPMVLQLPVFIAFYSVLGVAIQMRGASWLWVTDLSQPEHLPIHVLPIVMTIAQFVMQNMTPTPVMDPSQQSQQKIMQFMPLIFFFMFYNVSSGLVLYWLTSNLVGIVQQWLINKSMPAPATPAAPAVPVRKGGGKR